MVLIVLFLVGLLFYSIVSLIIPKRRDGSMGRKHKKPKLKKVLGGKMVKIIAFKKTDLETFEWMRKLIGFGKKDLIPCKIGNDQCLLVASLSDETMNTVGKYVRKSKDTDMTVTDAALEGCTIMVDVLFVQRTAK